MSTKLQLLKLSKKELVKKCKKNKVSSNGTKTEMIDRLLAKKTKKSKLDINNEQTSFYLFKSIPKLKLKYTSFETTFGIKEILFLFMEYLSIYTMSNFISAFPKYNTYYNQSNIIKQVIQNKRKIKIPQKSNKLHILNGNKISKRSPMSTSTAGILDEMTRKYQKTVESINGDQVTHLFVLISLYPITIDI